MLQWEQSSLRGAVGHGGALSCRWMCPRSSCTRWFTLLKGGARMQPHHRCTQTTHCAPAHHCAALPVPAADLHHTACSELRQDTAHRHIGSCLPFIQPLRSGCAASISALAAGQHSPCSAFLRAQQHAVTTPHQVGRPGDPRKAVTASKPQTPGRSYLL